MGHPGFLRIDVGMVVRGDPAAALNNALAKLV